MRVTRRQLLTGAGASFLGLPLLRSVLAGPDARGRAPAPRRPKRFIFVFSANGQPRKLWFPSDQLPFQSVDGAADARVASLAALPQPELSPTLVPELSRFRDQLVLVRGLDVMQLNAWGHYAPKVLSGWPLQGQYRRTLDQVLAQSPVLYPTPPAHRSLHLLAQGPQSLEDPVSVAEIDGVATLIHGLQHPDEAFRRLFSSPTAAALGDTRRVDSERRILDRVLGQYLALSGDPRLGSEDRQRLAAHATLLDDLERRLLVSPTAPPTTCGKPGAPPHREPTNANMAATTEAHIDVLAAAIRCDLTRVATLQLCSSTDIRPYPEAEHGPFEAGHHLLTHITVPESEVKLGYINRAFARSVARLLEQLDAVEEPDTGRTFLDNTLIYWGNEFGTNYSHMASGMPVLLAGGKDVLRTGRYLDYRRTGLQFTARGPYVNELTDDDGGYEWRGRPYNQLLVSLLLAMGLTPADWERPDEPGFGSYGDSGGAYVLGDPRAPLPGLLV